MGQWKLAHSSLEESIRIYRESCNGVTWEIDTAKYYSLLSLQLMGNYKEVFNRLPSFLMEAKDRNDLYFWILLRVRILSTQYLIENK